MISTSTEENKQEGIQQPRDKIIRLCVLGATGIGKSSLCNFLLGQDDIFEVGDGFDCCTEKSESKQFIYNIDSEEIQFEITDTPGWFNASPNQRVLPRDKMIDNINECIKISKTGLFSYCLCCYMEYIYIYI